RVPAVPGSLPLPRLPAPARARLRPAGSSDQRRDIGGPDEQLPAHPGEPAGRLRVREHSADAGRLRHRTDYAAAAPQAALAVSFLPVPGPPAQATAHPIPLPHLQPSSPARRYRAGAPAPYG